MINIHFLFVARLRCIHNMVLAVTVFLCHCILLVPNNINGKLHPSSYWKKLEVPVYFWLHILDFLHVFCPLVIWWDFVWRHIGFNQFLKLVEDYYLCITTDRSANRKTCTVELFARSNYCKLKESDGTLYRCVVKLTWG